ncbi:ribose-5-phosphate isomerase [Synergistales bacterium]|nr:ribose-5-phosphate isomerase [Synergistales bacterium]
MKSYVIGCDNAAVGLKNTLREFLVALGYSVEDVGCDSTDDSTAYPYIAKRVCDKIIESNYEKNGLLICGTGLGVAMCANKFKGIRAGVCHDSFSAERLALSNNGNVICFGARIIGAELAKKILKEFVGLTFKDGFSTPKVAAIGELELENLK